MGNRIQNPKYLVGHWKLNGNARDLSGYGNNGTFNTPLYTENQFGKQAGDFNGAGWITCSNDRAMKSLTKNITICFWTRLNVLTASKYWIDNRTAASDGFALLTSGTGSIRFYLNTSFDISSPTPLVIGKWTHVAVVKEDSGGYAFYHDGNLIYRDTSTTTSISTNNGPMYIGRYFGAASGYLDGDMFGIRLYNVALTRDEILQLIERESL